MPLALVYVRQSKNRPGQRTVSPEVQEAECRALRVVAACGETEVYRDLNVSGGKRARRGLNALLERIKAGGVSVVAFYDPSRSFRSTRDALEFRAFLAEHPKVEIATVHGIPWDRSAIGTFSYTAIAAANQLEREMTAEKMRDAARYQIERGQMVGKVPIGYCRQDGRAVVDPTWSPVVAGIFEDYATGRYSTRDLTRRLNDSGQRPAQLTGAWRLETVARMLGRPVYAGLMPQGGRSGAGQLIPGDWPPIISRALWDRVQAVRAQHRPRGHVGGRPFRAYAFQGLVVCAACGIRLYGHTCNGGRNTYYRCRTGPETGGCGMSVREVDLLAWGSSLMEWLESAADWPELAPHAEALLARGKRPADTVEQIDANLKRVGQRFEWGDIGEDEYRERRGQLLALRAEVEAQAAPAAASLRFTGVCAAWEGGDGVVRRALLANLFAALDVERGGKVRVRPRPEVAAEVMYRMAGWDRGAAVRLA